MLSPVRPIRPSSTSTPKNSRPSQSCASPIPIAVPLSALQSPKAARTPHRIGSPFRAPHSPLAKVPLSPMQLKSLGLPTTPLINRKQQLGQPSQQPNRSLTMRTPLTPSTEWLEHHSFVDLKKPKSSPVPPSDRSLSANNAGFSLAVTTPVNRSLKPGSTPCKTPLSGSSLAVTTPVNRSLKPGSTPCKTPLSGGRLTVKSPLNKSLLKAGSTPCKTPLSGMKLGSPFRLATTPLRLMDRLTPNRRNSWCVNTPECCKDLEWSPRLDYRSPRTQQRWEFNSPLRGSPAKRLFSWGWEGEFDLPWIEDEPMDDSAFATENFIPFTDLDSRITHLLHVRDYESLPPTI